MKAPERLITLADSSMGRELKQSTHVDISDLPPTFPSDAQHRDAASARNGQHMPHAQTPGRPLNYTTHAWTSGLPSRISVDPLHPGSASSPDSQPVHHSKLQEHPISDANLAKGEIRTSLHARMVAPHHFNQSFCSGHSLNSSCLSASVHLSLPLSLLYLSGRLCPFWSTQEFVLAIAASIQGMQ